MLLLVGQAYRPEIDMTTLQIQQAASDPIPTCTFTLEDTGSVINIAEFQEVVVIDEQSVPNPTMNLALNPTWGTYTTNWVSFTVANLALSQHGGGGFTVTATNAANGAVGAMMQTTTYNLINYVAVGQPYMLSVFAQGASAVNLQVQLQILFQDAAGGVLLNTFQTFAISGSLAQYSIQGTAPAGCTNIRIRAGAQTTSSTNSGSITFTNIQFEPKWFTAIGQTYPTPFCASNQANCTLLPGGGCVRQDRKFTGFTNLIDFDNFAGHNRQIYVQASGSAWLMELTVLSTIYISKTDSFMINDFVSRFFTGIYTTNHVQTGVTFDSFGPNDDTIRKLMDDLSTSSTYRWYVDPYYDVWYLPVGYYSTLFDLTDNPNNVTSFAYSKYKRTVDFTQPCNRAHVLVSGGPNVVRVTDAASYGQYNTTFFDRKIDDSTVITTNNDAYGRGLAEVTAFGFARVIIKVQTDQKAAQPLLPGNSVIITNTVDGIGPVSFLIQKVTISCMGADRTGTVRFLYDAELGAYNANLTNYLVRAARGISQTTSSALNTAQENIVVVEHIGSTETTSHTP